MQVIYILSDHQKCQKSLLSISSDLISTAMIFQMQWEAPPAQRTLGGTWTIFPHSCSGRYGVFTVLNLIVVAFHFPWLTSFLFCSCSLFLLNWNLIGDVGAIPLSSSLLNNMHFASCFWKLSIKSAPSFLPHAQACTVFTSATDKRNVIWGFGHHFVAQISSNAIGSCWQLLTSSTPCLAWLCWLNGSKYLNVFQVLSTNHNVGRS